MNIWSFNNDNLFDLARLGRKVATCWLYDGKPILERLGDTEQIVNSVGKKITIQITGVSVRRFADVDEAWAVKEGEGDLTLRYWRDVHTKYFKQVCNTDITPNTKLVCMEFVIVDR